jgi:hypothetical protein
MFINPVEPASDLMVHHVVNAHQGLLSEEDVRELKLVLFLLFGSIRL